MTHVDGLATHTFTEADFSHPLGRALAEAAARGHNNQSARRALDAHRSAHQPAGSNRGARAALAARGYIHNKENR